MKNRVILLVLFLVFSGSVIAQEKGQLTGSFEANSGFYVPDTTIQGQNPPPYYNHEKSSSEAWLFLNYQVNDFTLQARYDLYNNSPLLNPAQAYTHQGIGFLSATKQFDKMTITAGSFYDQFGNGIVFRAYEERALGLDYAIEGVRVQYRPADSTLIKAFTGLQKNRFDVHPQVIKGANIEQVWGIGNVAFLSGAAFLNRTLDRATLNQLAADIMDTLNVPFDRRFSPPANVYAGSVYTTMSVGQFSLSGEYAQKSKEAVFITQPDASLRLENRDGNVMYANLNYGIKGLGFNFQYKKINTFILRASPYYQLNLLEGMMNYLPAISKQHTLRLPARYSISAQPLGEEGYSGEVTWSPGKKTSGSRTYDHSFSLSSSYVQQPSKQMLFREFYLDWTLRINRSFHSVLGIQNLLYNQQVYEQKPVTRPLATITPFWEWGYKFNAAKSGVIPSIRMELQYLNTSHFDSSFTHDYGDFVFALFELNLAPTWSFSFSDMYNINPTPDHNKAHYYSAFMFYTYHQTRFSFGYARQVAGVVCTGGLCRLEPAFSGFRFGLMTNF